MATRTARTAWKGGLQDGSGHVELTSSKSGTFDVTFPRRVADAVEGTSPEELVAAALSSCYCMQLSGLIGKAGGTTVSLEVTSDVSIGPDPSDGGLHLTGIHLTVRGKVEGIDEAAFLAAAADAAQSCPISKALAGVNITHEASLA